eukprot:121796_1
MSSLQAPKSNHNKSSYEIPKKESLLKPSIYLKLLKKRNSTANIKSFSYTEKNRGKKKYNSKHIKNNINTPKQPKYHSNASKNSEATYINMSTDNTYLTKDEFAFYHSLVQKIHVSNKKIASNTVSIYPIRNKKSHEINILVLNCLNDIISNSQDAKTPAGSMYCDSVLDPNEWWICSEYYSD